jgi:hypothetical protein
MPKLTLPMSALLDSGQELRLVGDQRDIAALEASDYEDTTFLRLRYLAWHIAHRTGAYAGTWKAWNEKDCVEVTDTDADGEAGEELDPGRPGRKGPG